jgi:hypothetical protein
MGKRKVVYKVFEGKPKGRSPFERPGLNETIILKWILKKWDGYIDWIDLTQNKSTWRALLNAVMNLRVP